MSHQRHDFGSDPINSYKQASPITPPITGYWQPRIPVVVRGLDYFRPSFASWVVESARWVLLIGNLVGIVVGIMLAFLPDALMALEAGGSRWYSERRYLKEREAMNLTLDNWVAQFPRASGWIITFFALVLIAAFGLMLPAIR